MCGITGIFNLSENKPIDRDLLREMVLLLRHRGPEDFGIYKDSKIGMGHARLSIIDLEGGSQPIHNEDKTIWVAYNGEIFNYPELKEALISKGHQFYTRSDTEVLVHLYEEQKENFLNNLNGQFAFALWDSRNETLLLARDRMGIRPLFYTIVDGTLLFSSEIKSLFLDKRIKPEVDIYGLDQLFTFWSIIPPRTIFKNISQLAPASCLYIRNNSIKESRYWNFNYNLMDANKDIDYYSNKLFELLYDATRIRLRADVAVASYLSGGLDSSFISSLVKKHFNSNLQTFSISFSDRNYDESPFQNNMASFLKTNHKEVFCNYSTVGKIIPEVIWHAEMPVIRTAPAPMYLLAELVNQNKIKVVLTGEGADEILGGYDLFKETKIRRFWAKYPDSKLRPLLFSKLYQYVPNWPKKASVYLQAYYKNHLLETDKVYYSHLPRWETTSWSKLFFSDEVKENLKNYCSNSEFQSTLPADFRYWHYLLQAQYIEMSTILSGYLLSSQGDRMAMAHSVEGRYPFLDYRLIEFSLNLPSHLKIRGLNEKYLLKRISREYLPVEIRNRVKQAYRAPDSASFFSEAQLGYVNELLAIDRIKETGYFNPVSVSNLVQKCRTSDTNVISNKQNMAITGIITTMLLDHLFIRNFSKVASDKLNYVTNTPVREVSGEQNAVT